MMKADIDTTDHAYMTYTAKSGKKREDQKIGVGG